MKPFIKKTIREFLKESNNENLEEVKPNRFVYHKSNPYFRELISKQGLLPKGKSDAWLTTTKIDAEVIFATNSDKPEDWFDSPYDDDIYRIDTKDLSNKWFKDPNFDSKSKHMVTFEKIPVSSIELIYKGTGFSKDNLIYVKDPSIDGYNEIWAPWGLIPPQEKKIGFIHLSPASKEYDWIFISLPKALAIVEINILSEYRGQGYMKQTMKWLENFAQDNGFQHLFLRVDEDSEIDEDTLIRIYRDFGFRFYETDDDDGTFMFKKL